MSFLSVALKSSFSLLLLETVSAIVMSVFMSYQIHENAYINVYVNINKCIHIYIYIYIYIQGILKDLWAATAPLTLALPTAC